jgi:hypothetical protein
MEGNIPLLHGPLTPEEIRIQHQTERHEAEKKAENAYKERQLSISESTVKLSTANLFVTVSLVFFTLVNASFAGWQAWETRKSAGAARDAANASQQASDTADKSVLLAQKTERDSRVISEKEIKQNAAALEENKRQFAQTLGKMQESNTINRESLEAVQRAFIAYKSIEVNRGKDGNRIFWDFQPLLENAGNTPALEAVSNYSVVETNAPTVPQQIFESGGEPLTLKLLPASIAPKAVQETPRAQKNESEIFGLDLGDQLEHLAQSHPRSDFYICGWTVYRDVFPNTNPHVTEFCQHLVTASIINGSPPKLRFDFEYCPQHNCTDEYCSDYKQIVAYAESRMAK